MCTVIVHIEQGDSVGRQGCTVAHVDAELVTVTDSAATVTWTTVDRGPRTFLGAAPPVPCEARLLLASADGAGGWEAVGRSVGTAHHFVEVTGLLPGRRYRWRIDAPDGPDGAFTTLVPPSGPELGRVAVLNDLHVGERVAGLLLGVSWLPGGGFPPGSRADLEDPYWHVAATAAVAAARARGCDLLVANGDLTASGALADLLEARTILDGFGTLGGPPAPGGPAYRVTRGNHDGPARRGGDAFADVFAAGFAGRGTRFATAVGPASSPVRVVGLDSVGPDGRGALAVEDLDLLDAELTLGDPTVVLLHHPPGDGTRLPRAPAGVHGVRPSDAARLRGVVARHPGVLAVVAGHTHRARRARAGGCGRVPFVEAPAVKEYPLGWTELRVFAGGVLSAFRTVADPVARAWAARTRRAALGRWGPYAAGRLADRCWVSPVAAPFASIQSARHAICQPPSTTSV